jgi:hypothetical protein
VGPIGYRLRSWGRTRWRTAVALALVVALAGGVALALLAGAVRTITAPDRYSRWRGALYDVNIMQNNGKPRLAELDALPATGRLDAATFVFGGLDVQNINAQALIFAGSIGPLGARLVQGRLPEPTRPDEFVVTRNFFRHIHAHLGDHLDLVTFTQAQADASGFDAQNPAGPKIRGTLVGVIDGPSDLDDNSQLALFPRSLLDQGDIGTSGTVVVAALTPGSTMADLRQQLSALPGCDTFSLQKAEWVDAIVRKAVSAQGQGLAILGIIVAVATVVVLGQLFARQLRLGDDERAVLLSVGLSRRQVVAEPVGRAAIAAVAGAIAAAVVAYLGSGFFPVDFVRRIEPHPGDHFDLLVLGLGTLTLALALVVWTLGAVIVQGRAHDGGRPASITEKLAAALPSPRAALGLRFAFARSTDQSRRPRTPLIGMIAVFALLFGALTFRANLAHVVDTPSEYGFNYDVGIGQGASTISPDIQKALTDSPDVGAATLYGNTNVTAGPVTLPIIGMRTIRGGLVPDVLSGRLPQSADEVALGTVAARRLHAKVGDTIPVSGPSGDHKLKVTGLALVPPVGGADGVGEDALVTEAGLLALDPSATLSTAAINIAPHAKPGAAHRISQATQSAVGGNDPPPTIVNLRRVRNVPLLVAVAVGVLALLSLGHLIVSTVRRQRRDHAILRAVGATPRWLRGVVHWQVTITTAVIVAVAVPIGTALGRTLYGKMVEHVGARTDVLVPFAVLAAAMFAAFVLANALAVVPARVRAREAPSRLLTIE